MNWDLGKASAHTIEYTHNHQWGQQPGACRILAFVNTGNMANYETILAQNTQNPSAKDYRYYGRSKYGFALNAEPIGTMAATKLGLLPAQKTGENQPKSQ